MCGFVLIGATLAVRPLCIRTRRTTHKRDVSPAYTTLPLEPSSSDNVIKAASDVVRRASITSGHYEEIRDDVLDLLKTSVSSRNSTSSYDEILYEDMKSACDVISAEHLHRDCAADPSLEAALNNSTSSVSVMSANDDGHSSPTRTAHPGPGDVVLLSGTNSTHSCHSCHQPSRHEDDVSAGCEVPIYHEAASKNSVNTSVNGLSDVNNDAYIKAACCVNEWVVGTSNDVINDCYMCSTCCGTNAGWFKGLDVTKEPHRLTCAYSASHNNIKATNTPGDIQASHDTSSNVSNGGYTTSSCCASPVVHTMPDDVTSDDYLQSTCCGSAKTRYSSPQLSKNDDVHQGWDKDGASGDVTSDGH